MKAKVIIPLLLVAFLAGSAAGFGQDKNQKKIERLQKKIEKQQQKLHELTGQELNFYRMDVPKIDMEEIEKIKQDAMIMRDKAMEEARAQMEDHRMRLEEERERMDDQRKDMQERVRIIREENLDNLKDIKESEIEILKDLNGKKLNYYYKAPNLVWKGSDPVVMGENFKFEMPPVKAGVYTIFDDKDALNIENKLEGETQSADFPYEVKDGSDGLTLNVSGSIDEGKVVITVKEPDGTLYNEYTLSPLANVEWKQTISFDDENAEKMMGKWVVSVNSTNAKGAYKVHISSR
jgi:hypothetical protein